MKSTPGARRRSVRLPAEPTSAGAARRYVEEWVVAIDGRDPPVGGDAVLRGAVVHDAVLCVSELVGNALQHTASRAVTLTISLDGAGLRIEVGDDSPVEPVARPAPDGEGGRGLGIVSSITSRWGVEHHAGDGKSVWATIALDAGSQPDAARKLDAGSQLDAARQR